MMSPEDFEKEIQSIQERNKRVEADKDWETSLLRRFFITLFTYLALGIYLNIIRVDRPWLNAIVPAIAFMLSTLTLPLFKKIWLKYFHKK